MTKGAPKALPKKADSGKIITSNFCGDCGSTLWRESDTYAGLRIIKAGTLDGEDALESARPALELFTANRISWLPDIEGTQLNKGA